MKKQLTTGIEWLLFSGLLLTANAGLFTGTPRVDWLLLPAAVNQGEWWRLLLHPWVHVSVYHLLLDATAFISLFFMLDRRHPQQRWLILAAAWIGQLSAVWWGDAQLKTIGLCGLSGIAHGLFAAVALQWRQQPELKQAGNLLLAGILVKCLWEAATGHVFLAAWHIGTVGNPLTLCHAGGVLGALAAYPVTAPARPDDANANP